MVLVVKNLPANAGDKDRLVQFLGWDNPLEEGMATHSGILAWKIPWTEKPGRLQSILFYVMKSQTPLKRLSMHA